MVLTFEKGGRAGDVRNANNRLLLQLTARQRGEARTRYRAVKAEVDLLAQIFAADIDAADIFQLGGALRGKAQFLAELALAAGVETADVEWQRRAVTVVALIALEMAIAADRCQRGGAQVNIGADLA